MSAIDLKHIEYRLRQKEVRVLDQYLIRKVLEAICEAIYCSASFCGRSILHRCFSNHQLMLCISFTIVLLRDSRFRSRGDNIKCQLPTDCSGKGGAPVSRVTIAGLSRVKVQLMLQENSITKVTIKFTKQGILKVLVVFIKLSGVRIRYSNFHKTLVLQSTWIHRK